MLKTKNKIYIIIVITGAVLGSSAPFIHITFPKTDHSDITLQSSYDKKEISVEIFKQQKEILKANRFGFKSIRSFLFALGFPFTLLCSSLVLLYASKHINDKMVKKGILTASIAFQFTAIYFIIWTVTAHLFKAKDFDRSVYYLMMALSSILVTIAIVRFFISKLNHKYQIATLIDFIVNIRKELFHTKSNEHNITTKKKEFDNNMYETFEKIVK